MKNWLGITLAILAILLVLIAFYRPGYCSSLENLDSCPIGCLMPATGSRPELYMVHEGKKSITYGSTRGVAEQRWKRTFPNCPVPKWQECTVYPPVEEEDQQPEIVGKVVCYVTEYEQPPDDTVGPASLNEVAQIQDAAHTLEYLDDDEEFRIHRGGGRRGGGGGGRRGGGGGGRRGGGGGRRGRRGGGGRHGGWPWRTWPRYYWGRPWRSYWWRSYPEIYSYPVSFYNQNWVMPVQRFSIRLGPKSSDHPFFGKGSDLGYMISTGNYTGCGNSGAHLQLRRGQTYEFDIYTASDCVTGRAYSPDERQPFFFTTSGIGGSQTGELFDKGPIVNGTLRITITNDLPQEFYYQSSNDKYVGGYVSIVN